MATVRDEAGAAGEHVHRYISKWRDWQCTDINNPLSLSLILCWREMAMAMARRAHKMLHVSAVMEKRDGGR